MVVRNLIAAAWLAATMPACAQGTKADYARADKLRELTKNKVFKSSVRPHWASDGKSFWYRNELADGKREFVRIETASGKRSIIPEPEAKASFAESLSEIRPSSHTGAETSVAFVNNRSAAVAIFWITPEGKRQAYGVIPPGKTHRQHTFEGHVWLVTNGNGGTLFVVQADANPLRIQLNDSMPVMRPRGERRQSPISRPAPTRANSPDGKRRAFVRDNNLWVEDVQSKVETPLTKDGAAADGYAEEFHWSPNGKYLAAKKIRRGTPRFIHIVESAPRSQLQPKLLSLRYDKPGDVLDMAFVHLFDVAEHKEIPVAHDLTPTPWSIGQLHWEPDSKRLTFIYNQRGHQTLRLLAVEAVSGKTTALIEESSKTFIDYSGKFYSQTLDGTGEIIWMSERDGWNHLYLFDGKTGQVKNPITHGKWVVRGVDRVDPQRRQIWFRASGIDPDQDPYYVHYCRVDFDGSKLVRLTSGDGTHRIEYSPDGNYLLDTWSRVDLPPVTELRRADTGKLICELERADWSKLLATGWQPPERLVAKGRDATTDIYGVLWRPTNFDASRKYPVIEQIYAGPQNSFVPKGFANYYRAQALSELGFIVVQIDGMGTSNRSKAFHDVCWKNLGDAGFADRILWLKAAARKYPYLDLTRVGIYGGSAGGQNALRGLLAYPNFYKVGVADCGCHDNRMDKVWWNELWMGWPVGPHYAAQSNVTNAHQLRGKLLLTVGELDQNVDPASTMQVVDALIKADKDFDLLVVPGGHHGVGETPYANRRRMDFFVRHLHGVEPRN